MSQGQHSIDNSKNPENAVWYFLDFFIHDSLMAGLFIGACLKETT
jgi:hypothetical protein